jgi:hypothetical protein
MKKNELKKIIIKILKFICNIYNNWYGIINAVLTICLLTQIKNTVIIFILLALAVIDFFTWYKNIFKNLTTKSELFANIRQNNSLCVYGGIGSGKSTVAEFIINKFIPPEKRYYNTIRDGYKAFTNEHLLLLKRLEDGAGIIVDESGGQADAYHYEKKDNATRKRIDYLNKFFRQWYTDDGLLIYVDQCQGNNNTSIYKNIYYVIQCCGVSCKPSALLPHYLTACVLWFFNKGRQKGTKINNPFTNVCIDFMEFQKLGDYAEHYNVTIEDKDHKKLCGSIYQFFGSHNTYVFRNFNPAKKDNNPYIWGTDKLKDYEIMEKNFNFKEIRKDLDNSFLDY